MDKTRWPEFISSRLKSQISLENVEKAQTWGIGLLALLSLSFALNGLNAEMGTLFIFGVKAIFLMLFHLVVAFGFYLPGMLQKSEKAVSRTLGIRDFVSLAFISIALMFYTIVVMMISSQVQSSIEPSGLSNFFGVLATLQFLTALAYLLSGIFFISSFLMVPNALVKFVEKSSKAAPFILGWHLTLFVLLGLAYSEINPVGSTAFFEQFRIAGLFWIFIASSVFLIVRAMQESAVTTLSALEMEVAAGRLERVEDILIRFKEAFIPRRLASWIHRLSNQAAGRAHEIAQNCHESVTMVSRDNPSEIDLRQVEDRYRKADGVFKKLEKEHQRFAVSVSLYSLSDTEREKIELLRDQFSRELRHAKLELAQVRKRIDEKLVSIKNIDLSSPSSILSTPPSSNVPKEQVPLNR